MKWIKIFAAMSVLCAAPASGQEWVTKAACDMTGAGEYQPVLSETVQTKAQSVENGVGRLWRITSASGAVSYLWGTMHSSAPEILLLPDRLREALSRATIVATEYSLEFGDREEFLDGMFKPWTYVQDGQFTDFSFLDERLEPWIKARLAALGYNDGTLAWLTHAGLGEVLLSSPCDDFRVFSLPIQDNLLTAIGASHGARNTGLEPQDTFRKVMSDKDRRDVSEALIEMYASYLDPAGYQSGGPVFPALYLDGRIAEMMELDRELLAEFYGEQKADRLWRLAHGFLVGERNITFVRTAIPLLENGDALLAVGAFHLPGPNGMVAMLRDAGYQVERVRTAGEVQ